MSEKDEIIDSLRLKLARAEGERDEARRQHAAPYLVLQPYPVLPSYPSIEMGYTCSNCGMWVIGPHACYHVQPTWTYPVIWSNTIGSTTVAAPSTFTITNFTSGTTE